MWIQSISDAGNNQSLKVLHDYQSKDHWSIVIQAFHCGNFMDANAQLQAGRDSCVTEVLQMSEH